MENSMDKKNLFIQAICKFLLGIVILGILIFLPAGSLKYWQGWLLMGILFVPMFVAGLVMVVKNPELLRKRLNAKEEEKCCGHIHGMSYDSVKTRVDNLLILLNFNRP